MIRYNITIEVEAKTNYILPSLKMNINNYRKALDHKTVLITGAGGGIGFETAKYFVAMGAKVIILEIDKEKGESAEKLSIQYIKIVLSFIRSIWRTRTAY